MLLPRILTVKGNNEIKLDNVLVGEVWICSGQSNMEWRISQCANSKEEIAAAKYPNIRLFDVPGHTVHPLPQRKGKENGKYVPLPPSQTLVPPGTTLDERYIRNSMSRRLGRDRTGEVPELNPGPLLTVSNQYPNFPNRQKSVAAYTRIQR